MAGVFYYYAFFIYFCGSYMYPIKTNFAPSFAIALFLDFLYSKARGWEIEMLQTEKIHKKRVQ